MATKPSFDLNDTALPSPPFYRIPNLTNLRDAAYSLTTEPGVSLRTGVLFRSADPSRLDAAGWSALQDLGVRTIFDLRSEPEIERVWAGLDGEVGQGHVDAAQHSSPSPPESHMLLQTDATKPESKSKTAWESSMNLAEIKRTWIPIFAATDYSPERLAERYMQYMSASTAGFAAAYADLLRSAGPAFGTILLHLAHLPLSAAATGGSGVLIHCTAGKDRTGIFFGLLFSFLGVSREDIAREYALTEQGLAPLREEIVARLMQSTGFKNYMATEGKGDADAGQSGEEPGRAAALRMISARKESMSVSLDMVQDVYGGAEAYFRKECGVDEEVLARVRKNLVMEER